jgi:hypothetical protein
MRRAECSGLSSAAIYEETKDLSREELKEFPGWHGELLYGL